MRIDYFEGGKTGGAGQQRGAALIILLAVLSLCVVLMVGFLSTVRQDYSASSAYAEGVEAERLAATSVELIKGQIRQATADPEVAWISQPGLIRTFDADGQKDVFKLYSAEEMVLRNAGSYNPEDEVVNEVPNDWDARPDEFADLNEPVWLQGQWVYPIADPAAANASTGAEGFDFGTDASKSDGNAPGSGRSRNALPMPVRWLYQFADGSLGSYEDIDFNDRSNPPVARMAFWADDETSKVNINTASEGKFFDYPKGAGRESVELGEHQPVRNEFNRFPGHPASTSLSAVFPGLRPRGGLSEGDRYNRVAAAVPRISSSNDGFPVQTSGAANAAGSQGGTLRAWQEDELMIAQDSDRLYASIDELLFTVPYDSNDGPRPLQHTNLLAPGQGQDDLTRYRFFVTTNSSSPELNAFNRPRISLWPLNPEECPSNYLHPPVGTGHFRGGDKWNAKDKLLAFCTTVGRDTEARPFYFQRVNGFHPTYDYDEIPNNQALYDYLLAMTQREIPAVGRSLADKYGNNRYSILTMAWDYVRSQINIENTGEGSNQAERTAKMYSFPRGQITHFWGQNISNHVLGSGRGSIIPLRVTKNGVTSKGIGRFPTFPMAHVQLIAERQDGVKTDGAGNQLDSPTNNLPYSRLITEWRKWLADPARTEGNRPPDTVRRQVRLMFVVNTFNPMAAFTPGLQPRYQYRITGQLNLGDGPADPSPEDGRERNAVHFSGTGQFLGDSDRSYAAHPQTWHVHHGPGDPGYDNPLHQNDGENRSWLAKQFGGQIDEDYFPFVSEPIAVDFPIAFRVDSDGDGVFDHWWLRYGQKANYPADPNGIEPDDPARNPGPVSDPKNAETFDDSYRPYDLPSNPAELDEAADPPKMTLVGGALQVEVFAGTIHKPFDPTDRTGGHVLAQHGDANSYPLEDSTRIQTFSIDVPDTVVPVPMLGLQTRWASPHRSPTVHPSKDDRDNGIGKWKRTYSVFEMRDFSKRNQVSRLDTVMNAGMHLNVYDRDGATNDNNYPSLLHPSPVDVVRGLNVDGADDLYGDVLYFAARPDPLPADWWTVAKHYHEPNNYLSGVAHGFFGINGNGSGPWLGDVTYSSDEWFNLMPDSDIPAGSRNWEYGPVTTVNSTGLRRKTATGGWTLPGVGDFQSGVRGTHIGSFVPLVDTGWTPKGSNSVPYFATTNGAGSANIAWGGDNYTGLTFSPTRQIPSPIKLGWIPSRVQDPVANPSPWETLLFCPNPAGGRDTHRGWADRPADHYLLDLFWMPVVDPYAISEPFQTSGKINLNYQMAPFTYIRRATGLHAVMKAEEVGAIPHRDTGGFNVSDFLLSSDQNKSLNVYYAIDLDETLLEFEDRFANNEPFVTASQIAEVFLYPENGPSWSASNEEIENWWESHGLTGDNLREMPYDRIYPRVCVRSNAFKVHMRVQSVKLSPQGRINVTSEYRGEEILERYLDPNLASYGDRNSGSINAQFPPLNEHYRFRQVNRKRFGP